MTEIIFKLQFAVSLYMVGIIWLTQLIHYPAFLNIEENQFTQFHQKHSAVMGLLAGPAMIIELFAAFYFLVNSINLYSIINFIFVITIWSATFLLSVPKHNKLSTKKDFLVIQSLINTNWIRTMAWSVRGLGLTYLLITGATTL